MRLTLVMGAALAALTLASPSQAATGQPGVSPGHDNITLVEGGCGPGGFRAANGYCYRRRGPPPPPPPYRRACGPGFHPTPYGCRPNF